MEEKKGSPRGVKFATEDKGIGAAVLECFKKHLPDESTTLLTSKRTFTETSFSTEKWTKPIRESFLKEDIKELTTMICDHVSQRTQERIDPNHPHHLMCYELIIWLITTLPALENNKTNGDVTDANRKKINARINYITAIMGDRGILSPDKEDDTKLIETLKAVTGILLTRTLPKFLTHSTSPRSARKKTSPRIPQVEVSSEALINFCTSISALKKQSVDILEACSGFLFYLPSTGTNLPKPLVAKLCQNDPSYQVFLATRFGQLYQVLLQSTEFGILFNQSSGRLTDRRNPFLNNAYEVQIPQPLLNQLHLRADSSFIDFFQQNTSIHPLLLQHEDALKLIAKMLALLWELSKLVVACEETNILASLKKELICFRPTQEQIRSLMDSFVLTAGSMKTGLKAIVASITEIVGKLPNKDQRSPDDNNWGKNLIQMKTYYGLLAPLLKDLDSFTDAVEKAVADIPYSENLNEQVISEFRAYITTMISIIGQTQSFCKKDKVSAASPAASPSPQREASRVDRPQEKAPAALAAVDSSKKESPRNSPPTQRPAPPTTSPTQLRRAEEGLKPTTTGNPQPTSTTGVTEASPRGRSFSMPQKKTQRDIVTEQTEGSSSPLAFLRKKSGPAGGTSPSTSPRQKANSMLVDKSEWPAPGTVPTVPGQQSPHSKTASPTTSPRAQEDGLSSPKSAWPEPGRVTTVPVPASQGASSKKTSPATSPRNSGIAKKPSPTPSPRETGLTATGRVEVSQALPNKSTQGTSPRESNLAAVAQVKTGTAAQPKSADPPVSTPAPTEIKKQVSRSSVRDRAATWGVQPPKNVSESVWKETSPRDQVTQDSKQAIAAPVTSPQLPRQNPQPAKAPTTTAPTATKQPTQPQKSAPKPVSPPSTIAPTPPVKADKDIKTAKEHDDEEIIIITNDRTELSAHKPAAPEESIRKKEPNPELVALTNATTSATLTIEKPSDSTLKEEPLPEQKQTAETKTDRKPDASFSDTEKLRDSAPLAAHPDQRADTNTTAQVAEVVETGTRAEPVTMQKPAPSEDTNLRASEPSSEPTRESTGRADSVATEETTAKPAAGRGGLQRSSGKIGSLRFKTPPKPPASTVIEESRPRSSTAGTPPRPNTPISGNSVRVETKPEKLVGENSVGTQTKTGTLSPKTSPRTSQISCSDSKPVSPPLSPETKAKLGNHRKAGSPRPSVQSVFEGRAPSRETTPRAAQELTTPPSSHSVIASHEEHPVIAPTIDKVAADQPAFKANSGDATSPKVDKLTAAILEAEALEAKQAGSPPTSRSSKRETLEITEEQVQELTQGLLFFDPPKSASPTQSAASTGGEPNNDSKLTATSTHPEEPKKEGHSTTENGNPALLAAAEEEQHPDEKPAVTTTARVVDPRFPGRGPIKAILDQQHPEKSPGSGSTSPRTSRAAPLTISSRRGSIGRRNIQFERVRRALPYQNTLRRAVDVLDQDNGDPNVIFVGQDQMMATVKSGDIGEPCHFTEHKRLQAYREEEANKKVTKDNIIDRVKEQLRDTPNTLQLDRKNLEGICVKLLCDFILSDYILCWDKALKNNPNNAETGKIYITQQGDYFVRTPRGSVVKGSLPQIPGLKFWGDYHFSFNNDPEDKNFDVNSFALKPHVLKCAAEMSHIRTPTQLGILKLSNNPDLFLAADCLVNLNGANGPITKAKIKEFPAATALSLLLQKDKSLRTLSLADCNFCTNDDENLSFRTFTSGLRDNESVEMLDLSRCSLTNVATAWLNRALQAHPKITVLLLRGNPFDNIPFGNELTAGNELLELVTTNKNIVFIDLQETNLPAEIINQIEAQADANGKAQEQAHRTESNPTFGK